VPNPKKNFKKNDKVGILIFFWDAKKSIRVKKRNLLYLFVISVFYNLVGFV